MDALAREEFVEVVVTRGGAGRERKWALTAFDVPSLSDVVLDTTGAG